MTITRFCNSPDLSHVHSIPFQVRVHSEEQECDLNIPIQDTYYLLHSGLTEVGMKMTAIYSLISKAALKTM